MSISPRHLLGRFFLLAGILGVDIVLLAVIPHPFHFFGPLAPFGIVSYAVFLGLGYSEIRQKKQDLRFGMRLFLAHTACVVAISLTDIANFYSYGFLDESIAAQILLRAVLVAAVAALALACIPLEAWIDVLRSTGLLWLYSILAGAAAFALRFPLQSFWDASRSAPVRLLQIFTFHSVQAVLVPLLPGIRVDPDTFVIGTQRFLVIIGEPCSGLEGLGLVLVFTTIWLWYLRKESRFPQALLLIPSALACIWILNILRISALVLIGAAGYPDVAMLGFHSQAGWIAFTLVAFTFSMATRRLAWVRKAPIGVAASQAAQLGIPASVTSSTAAHYSVAKQELAEAGESPAIRAYLVPFLAILAASFLSKAASGEFEWLYPLRLLAAAIAIWYYRVELKQIDWRFGWLAPVAGAAVCVVLLIPSFWHHSASPSQLVQALAELSPTARWTWIALRIAAAVVTVPIAEELAFRGYLARRLVNREFDTIPFSAVTILSIAVSSAAFGLLHGGQWPQWIVGIFAGLAYAGAMKWKGRLGDAVVAHATTNLLLAIWVLTRGDWSQWGH